MALESGYYYITLDSFTPSINPTRSSLPKAEKKIVKVTTLTQTVKQHWQKKTSDKCIELEWDCMPKSDLDTFMAKDEANYTTYVFTDIYNNSYNVIIADLTAVRLGMLDSDGFAVSMILEIIS